MRSKRIRRFGAAVIAAGAVVLVDQGTKALALNSLSAESRIPLLGDLLGLQLAFNPGAVLSFGAGVTGVITTLGVAATVLLVVAAARSRNTCSAVGLGFILGGAIGNLIDRLFAAPAFGVGHVTDFLAYGNLFIGNFADIALGIGAIVLVVGLRRAHPGKSRSDADTAVLSAQVGESVSGT